MTSDRVVKQISDVEPRRKSTMYENDKYID